MDVTLLGIVINRRDLQPPNAESPMDVTPSKIVMDWREGFISIGEMKPILMLRVLCNRLDTGVVERGGIDTLLV